MRWVGTLALLIVLAPSIARAASGPKWSPSELAEFADVVLTGRIDAVTTGWDRDVNAIYTFVSLTVHDVLKGNISAQHITIKQLGGSAGGMVLSIVDQPRFIVGEDVLLYLEARPRDGTLYTTALWQGKWNVQRGASGESTAVRHAPVVHGASQDRQSMHAARVAAAAADASPRVRASRITTQIAADATVQRGRAAFNLLGPFRFLHVPAVDVQSGGQPGLAGGGFSHVLAAIQRWNTAGSSFRFAPGLNSVAPRCSGQLLGNGRVTITFMDPCGEMSNSGGTLAMGGAYYEAGEGGTSNGQAFDRAVEGFVINNDSPTALSFLTNPGCFEDVQTHELGHVLGLHHSADPGALMYPTIDSSSCWNGASGLRADDLQGLFFIYGTGPALGAAAPSAAPTGVAVVVDGAQLTVTWTDPSAGSAAAATSYRVDFRAGHQDDGPVVASVSHATRMLTVAIPTGTAGPFNVTVSGVNGAGAGPQSARSDFTLGAGPACGAAPSAPASLTAAVIDGFARVNWSAVPGATSYRIQAGSQPGGADLFALTDLGATTEAGANVAPGFQGWVRVVAANACGISNPTDVFIQ
jgi:hypothetical protein